MDEFELRSEPTFKRCQIIFAEESKDHLSCPVVVSRAGQGLSQEALYQPMPGYKPGNISSMWLQDFISQFWPEIPSNLLCTQGQRKVCVDFELVLEKMQDMSYQILCMYSWNICGNSSASVGLCDLLYMSCLVRDECSLPVLL